MKKMQKNILKSTILGPIVAAVTIAITYVVLWGISTIFSKIHGFLLNSIWPWVVKYGWVILVIWAFIIISALIFGRIAKASVKEREKEETPVEETADEDEGDDQETPEYPDVISEDELQEFVSGRYNN